MIYRNGSKYILEGVFSAIDPKKDPSYFLGVFTALDIWRFGSTAITNPGTWHASEFGRAKIAFAIPGGQ